MCWAEERREQRREARAQRPEAPCGAQQRGHDRPQHVSRAPALRRRRPHVTGANHSPQGGGAGPGLGMSPLGRQRAANSHPVPPMGRSTQPRVGPPGSQPGAAPAEGGRVAGVWEEAAGGSAGKCRLPQRVLPGVLPCRSVGRAGPARLALPVCPPKCCFPAARRQPPLPRCP